MFRGEYFSDIIMRRDINFENERNMVLVNAVEETFASKTILFYIHLFVE